MDTPTPSPAPSSPEQQGAAQPPPVPQPKPRRAQRSAAAPAANAPTDTGAAQPSPPPWANFNAVQGRDESLAALRKQQELVPSGDMKRYFCKASCGNGKYTKGREYRLSSDNPILQVEDDKGQPKFFKELG